MTAKKALFLALSVLLLVLLLWIAFNVLIDPFGVFGDPLLDWYGYNATQNPRVAKIAWLREHHEDYNAYVIGSSTAASYDPAELKEYLGLDFYNLFVYGSRAADYRDLAAFVLENYETEMIVLNLGLHEADTSSRRSYDLNYRMHALTTGEPLLPFYLRYALCSPEYGLEKLRARAKDTELPQMFDVFLPESGCYDKRVRDVERIGDPEAYLSAHHGEFTTGTGGADLPYIDECIRAVADIRDMCSERGVELLVIVSPLYAGLWEEYSQESIRDYMTALSQTVDYWDFSVTSLSLDERYFYDSIHFRNAVGSMILAEIFGNDAVWRPEDFGEKVTAANRESHLAALFSALPEHDPASYTANVPVLLYHHFGDTPSDTVVTPDTFETHIRLLAEAGYETVTCRQLIDYVSNGGSLPEKPICITMDDGYLSNYEIAMPILEKYGFTATVFAIGVSVGHDRYYKDTTHTLIPHFSWDHARAMADVIEFQSHTWDMHQWAPFETGDRIRETAVPLEGESEAEYAAALLDDLAYYDTLRTQELDSGFIALAYPGGQYTTYTEVLVHQAGIPITFSIDTSRQNVLVRGLPQTLYALSRWNMTEDVTAEELLAIASGAG